MSTPIADTCEDCAALLKWVFSVEHGVRRPVHDYPKDGSMLLESPNCKLCDLIKPRFPLDAETDMVTDIEIRAERDQNGNIAALHVELAYDTHPYRYSVHRIQLWTEKGSVPRTYGKVSTRPALGQYENADTTALIQTWLSRCMSNHVKCHKSLAETNIDELASPIPADRILDVGNSLNEQIRLVRTKGIRGRYCALSHCWGSPDKHPLRSTTINEDQLFTGIRCSDLPRTFRDAIHVVRRLNIRYLWIDSLCIIQDSKEHWRQESARMGAIYENAYLRIAASNANDATDGFLDRDFPKSATQAVPLPICVSVSPTDNITDTFNILLQSEWEGRKDPYDGPLASRAWVFQEARLARRSVSFMPGALIWDCKEDYLNDRDCHPYDFHGAQHNWYTWVDYVEEYTAAILTYESDRLIAIQGLANEMAKSLLDTYCLGLWLGDLPKMLLWRTIDSETGMHGLPNLPSWTWVGCKGKKHFLFHKYSWASEQQQIGARFESLDEISFSITLIGSLMPCRVSDKDVMGEEFAEHLMSPESKIMEHSGAPRRLLWSNNSEEGGLVGLVQLDRKIKHESLHCSIMWVNERREGDPLWKASENMERNETSVSINEKQEEPSDWDLIERHGKHAKYYWVLLMQCTAEENTFSRVGMGIVWPTPWVQKRPRNRKFQIV